MTHKTLTLGDIAHALQLEVIGDKNIEITGLATLKNAQKNQLAFLDSDKHRPYLSETQASAVVLRATDKEACPCAILIADQPRIIYARLAEIFSKEPKPQAGIHSSVIVGENCQLAASVGIGANCVIGNGVVMGENVMVGAGCVIGDDVTIAAHSRLWANVTVYYGSKIGSNVTLHSGAIIGSDGFGYTKLPTGWYKIPQLGCVVIHDKVEIGANTVIDRGALEDTVIGHGVILDNLIQIAHNVRIGDYTAIAGCVGIAGSTTIGKHCSIGGGSGIAGHITIGDNVILSGMSMVTNSITKPGVYSSGTGSLPNLEWRKSVARLHQLDNLFKRFSSLEKRFMQFMKGPSHD